ncbi:MAG TPA: putative sugar nucleotidyl transferase [Gemmata sp.]|nr:putative sugar nucleotidyl transferase [Gemmata sp.]
MRICIYEDRRVSGLEPLVLTRPVSDLLCGLSTLGEKQTRHFAATSIGHLCRPRMADLVRGRDPRIPVNDPTWLRSASTVLVNARWIPNNPPAVAPRERRHASRNPLFESPHLGMCGSELAYAVLDTHHLAELSPATLDDCINDWMQSLRKREVGGTIIAHPWDLIELNHAQIARDFLAEADPSITGFHPSGVAHVGHADLFYIHPTAKIDPMVVADTTHGPVSIGAGTVVQAFTRLEGPCAIGAGTIVQSGCRIRGGTTIGPQCRVGGEIESSILLGYANKYHDGFLGHSYIGEWVNLAAGTHVSDLRCDYEPVKVSWDGCEIATGKTKVGAIIGDHARTGLGVFLNCGSVIGPFAQILPTGTLAPCEIPAFVRSGPHGVKELRDVDRLLATAGRVMQRRGKTLSLELEQTYRSIAAAQQRREPEQVLPLRRSA